MVNSGSIKPNTKIIQAISYHLFARIEKGALNRGAFVGDFPVQPVSVSIRNP